MTEEVPLFCLFLWTWISVQSLVFSICFCLLLCQIGFLHRHHPLGPCSLTCCRNHVVEGTPFPYKGEALFPVCQPYHDPLSSAHLGWLSNWTPTTFARWAAVAMIALLPPGDDRGPPVAGAGWVSITVLWIPVGAATWRIWRVMIVTIAPSLTVASWWIVITWTGMTITTVGKISWWWKHISSGIMIIWVITLAEYPSPPGDE